MRRGECPQESNVQMHPIIARIACCYAVVIRGKTLSFGKCLLSASGAAIKVRVFGIQAKVVANDQLGRFRHDMNGSISPIHDLFRVTCSELQILPLVTCVRARSCRTATKATSQLAKADAPKIATVANS